MTGRRHLEGFVKDRNSSQPPPYSTQPPPQVKNGRTDRTAAAAGLKVKRGEKERVNHQAFGLSAPASGYNPNPMAARNFYSNIQYEQDEIQHLPNNDGGSLRVLQQQEQRIPVQGGAFDDTITTGLEDTTSELPYDGRPRDMNNQKGMEDDDQYEIQAAERHNQYVHRGAHHDPASKQRALQHKQSRSPLADTNEQHFLYGKLSTHAIDNRFAQAVSQQWPQEMPDRGGNVPSQQIEASNKLGHPDERVYSDDQRGYNEQQSSSQQGDDVEEDEDDGEGESQGSALPGPQGNGDFPKQEHRNGRFDPRSEGVETVVSTLNSRMSRRDENGQALDARLDSHHPRQLDHSDEQLKGLAYAELKKETWDPPASSQKRANPAGTEKPDYSFKDCVEYMVLVETPKSQVDFFELLSMEDFEEAGDVFIEKFTELMQKIRKARRKKRNVVMAFEKEIEAREKAVRGRSENLDTKLEDMKAGGEGVLRGKVKS